MARQIDLGAVYVWMRELEDQQDDPDPDVPVTVVMAKLLDVEHTDAFEGALVREASRTVELLHNHYARRHGVKVTPESAAALGLAQGITFAVAVMAERGEA